MQYTMPGNIIVEFDDVDADLVLRHRWHVRRDRHTMYARAHVWVNGKRTTLDMHCLIMQPAPGQEVDHIDGNGLHNQRSNLRVCSHAQNVRNRRRNKGKTSSQYKGVYPQEGLWNAQIRLEGLQVYLGMYASEVKAAHAYNLAAVEKHGQYACLNELPDDYDQSKPPTPTTANKSSRFRGVTWYKATSRWHVAFTIKGRTYSGGYHKDELVAARVYNDLAVLHLGDQAKLNAA